MFVKRTRSRWMIWAIRILHCIVSFETQFETWWWPSARAETCCVSNKHSTTLLVVFWLYYLHHLIVSNTTGMSQLNAMTCLVSVCLSSEIKDRQHPKHLMYDDRMTGPTKADVCHHISLSYSTMTYPTTVSSTCVTVQTKNEGLLSLIDQFFLEDSPKSLLVNIN